MPFRRPLGRLPLLMLIPPDLIAPCGRAPNVYGQGHGTGGTGVNIAGSWYGLPAQSTDSAGAVGMLIVAKPVLFSLRRAPIAELRTWIWECRARRERRMRRRRCRGGDLSSRGSDKVSDNLGLCCGYVSFFRYERRLVSHTVSLLQSLRIRGQ